MIWAHPSPCAGRVRTTPRSRPGRGKPAQSLWSANCSELYQSVRAGTHLYRIVRVPAQVKDAAAATQFILAETSQRIAAQRHADPRNQPHR